MNWKVQIDDRVYVATSTDELRRWYADGRLPKRAYVYHPLLERWMYPEELKELSGSPRPGDGISSPTSASAKDSTDYSSTVLAVLVLGLVTLVIGLKLPLLGLWLLVGGGVAGLYFYFVQRRSLGGGNPLGRVTIVGIALVIILGVVGLARTVGYFGTIQAEKVKAAKALEAEAAEKQRREKAEAAKTQRRAQLVSARDSNLTAARNSLEGGLTSQAREFLSLVQEVDPRGEDVLEVLQRIEEAERAAEEAEKTRREQTLVQAVRAVPASDTEENLRIYSELTAIRPEKDRYYQKFRFYRDRQVSEATTARKEIEKGLRQAYAKALRTKYLDSGMDIKVTVSGSHADRLTLEYILFNDVWTHNMQKGGLLNEMGALGFKRVDIKDGWDYHKYWTLD